MLENALPPEIGPTNKLTGEVQRLLLQNVDATVITGEVGLAKRPKEKFPNTYRTLGLDYHPQQIQPPLGKLTDPETIKNVIIPKRPAFWDEQEEGTAPFTDREFVFTVSAKINTSKEFDPLPKYKITIPMDSVVHYAMGKKEFYTDEDENWRVVEYNRRPIVEALRKQVEEMRRDPEMKADPRILGLASEASTHSNDMQENAELERDMGVAREATPDEIAALLIIMHNPGIIRQNPRSYFTGLVDIIDTEEGRHWHEERTNEENRNKE